MTVRRYYAMKVPLVRHLHPTCWKGAPTVKLECTLSHFLRVYTCAILGELAALSAADRALFDFPAANAVAVAAEQIAQTLGPGPGPAPTDAGDRRAIKCRAPEEPARAKQVPGCSSSIGALVALAAKGSISEYFGESSARYTLAVPTLCTDEAHVRLFPVPRFADNIENFWLTLVYPALPEGFSWRENLLAHTIASIRLFFNAVEIAHMAGWEWAVLVNALGRGPSQQPDPAASRETFRVTVPLFPHWERKSDLGVLPVALQFAQVKLEIRLVADLGTLVLPAGVTSPGPHRPAVTELRTVVTAQAEFYENKRRDTLANTVHRRVAWQFERGAPHVYTLSRVNRVDLRLDMGGVTTGILLRFEPVNTGSRAPAGFHPFSRVKLRLNGATHSAYSAEDLSELTWRESGLKVPRGAGLYYFPLAREPFPKQRDINKGSVDLSGIQHAKLCFSLPVHPSPAPLEWTVHVTTVRANMLKYNGGVGVLEQF